MAGCPSQEVFVALNRQRYHRALASRSVQRRLDSDLFFADVEYPEDFRNSVFRCRRFYYHLLEFTYRFPTQTRYVVRLHILAA